MRALTNKSVSTKTRMIINLGGIERIPPGEGREFEVAGIMIAVFHTRKDGLYAVQALCPHRSGHLADGFTGGGKLICPMHAYKFELASGTGVGHDCGALKTYPVSISQAGDILLTL